MRTPRGIETKPRASKILATGDPSDLEGGPTNEHDEDLTTDFCNYCQCRNASEGESGGHTDEGDHSEIPIPEGAFEDVELVVKSPAINRVEDLGEDKGVK